MYQLKWVRKLSTSCRMQVRILVVENFFTFPLLDSSMIKPIWSIETHNIEEVAKPLVYIIIWYNKFWCLKSSSLKISIIQKKFMFFSFEHKILKIMISSLVKKGYICLQKHICIILHIAYFQCLFLTILLFI